MALLHRSGETVHQRYRLIKTLGEGGCGVTYLAQDLQTGESVALKALSLRQVQDWQAIDRFEREARILARLNHPAIPRYLDYFQVDTEHDRAFYIAQQQAPGKSLSTWVQEGWRTTEAEVQQIAVQLLKVLIYLHEQKPAVVHRDIKPDNVIRHENGNVFLVDFGAVQETYHTTIARSSTVVGTFGYMAPEQFRGQAEPASDLYGLGATLLFLLTHRSPADLPTNGLHLDFRAHVRISDRFADWLMKLLEPDPDDRFASARQALRALRQAKYWSHPRKPLPAKWKKTTLLLASLLLAWQMSTFWRYVVLTFNPYESDRHCFRASEQGDIFLLKYCLSLRLIDANYGRDRGDRVSVSLMNVCGSAFWSCTMLHTAKNQKVAKVLLTHGADINAEIYKDVFGTGKITPIAAMINAAFVEKENVKSSRFKSIEKLEMAKFLLEQGATVAGQSYYLGIVPLQASSWFPDRNLRLELAKLMIAKGAKVVVRDEKGKTYWVVQSAQGLEMKEFSVDAAIGYYFDYDANPADIQRNLDTVKFLIANSARAGNTYYMHPISNQFEYLEQLLTTNKDALVLVTDDSNKTYRVVQSAKGLEIKEFNHEVILLPD